MGSTHPTHRNNRGSGAKVSDVLLYVASGMVAASLRDIDGAPEECIV